ncbi:MAG: CYTH domain-containing protein [Anaerobacillus sp.]
MSQEVEIEFKNMLTGEEYKTLLAAYRINKEEIKTQTNDYFDTKEFHIREKGAALRVRNKNGNLVLTLKEPATEGLLETHQTISNETFHSIQSSGVLPAGEVREQLKRLGVQSLLVHLGNLTTHRAELQLTTGLLVLDHSEYLDQEDYEMEFEVSDFEKGKRDFESVLTKHHIPKREAKNKILRFFLASKEQG